MSCAGYVGYDNAISWSVLTAAMSSIGKDKGTISFAFTVKGHGKWETAPYVSRQALDTNFYSGAEKKLENAAYTYTKIEFSRMCYYFLSWPYNVMSFTITFL